MCDNDDFAPVTRRVLLNTIKKISRLGGGVTLKRIDAGYIKRERSNKLNKFNSRKVIEKSKAQSDGLQNSNKYVLRTFINEIIDGKGRPRAILIPGGKSGSRKSQRMSVGKRSAGKRSAGKRTAGKRTAGKRTTGKKSAGRKSTGKKSTGKKRTVKRKPVRRLGSRLSKMFPVRCRSKKTKKRK